MKTIPAAIAVLADSNYTEAVKQVIYSSYVYGNWRGDYVLLAHEVPEEKLGWFKERNIHIVPTRPLIREAVRNNSQGKGKNWPDVVYSKLFLLHPDLNRYEKVIFLDADIIVRKDIGKLLSFRGFAARRENLGHNLLYQFVPDLEYTGPAHRKAIRQLQQRYRFGKSSFNVGVMVLPTKSNSPEGFRRITQLANELHGLAYFPEQAVFNLYFYNRWTNIPYVYNDLYVNDTFNRNGLWRRKNDRDAVVLHLAGSPKPWEPTSAYYNEWQHNHQQVNKLFDHLQQQGQRPTFISIRKIERLNMVNQAYGRAGRLAWKGRKLLKKICKPCEKK